MTIESSRGVKFLLAGIRNYLGWRCSQRRRRTVQAPVAAEQLETRSLLTPTAVFDFTSIVSNLSTNQRFFGSNNQAHAPYTVIRYGEGTLTSLTELPNTSAAVQSSGPLTFRFGSNDVNNPVEVVTLSTFDDGISDGLANEVYTADGVNDNPAVTLFLNGNPVATGFVKKLSLATSPQLIVTSPAELPSELQLTAPVGNDPSIYQELVAATGGTGILPFTLSAFSSQGSWAGAANGSRYSSSGTTAIASFTVDYGDLPDPAYRTLLVRDGARHRIVNSLRLGSTITAETNGKPSAAATLDSDDGVLLPTLNVGRSASVTLTVSGGSGFLDGWIDFNQDGDFDDVGEHVLDDSPVAAGIQNLPISIPVAAKLGSTFARFRLSSARVTNPRGLAKDGEVEDYAVTVMLATPVIASMAATTESQRPEFKWSAVPGATSYTVFITNQSTGQSPFQTATVTGTSYTPVTDLGIGRFNIWVQAKNSAGKSIWSPQFNIQIATRTAIAPMDRRLITARPTLTWKALPGAARYDVLINDQLAGGPPILRDTNVTSPSYSPRGDMPLGLYRAWVRGIAQDGTPAGWSTMVEFYVVPAPVVVSGQNPTFDRTPTFAWQAVTGAASYTVLIKNLNSGATTLNKTNITDLSFTPSANLKDGAYRWWVLGKAANGTQGSWTTPFDIFIGGRTDILSPIGQTSNRRPTFQWKTVDGAIRYELWVNQVNGQAKYVHVTNLTAPSYTPLSNLQAGLYRAWVRSVSSTNESIWSNSLDFTIL